MAINFFEHQQTIARNLTMFIRLNGYSKLSLSKLTSISRPTIDQILKGESPSRTPYNSQIAKITEIFELKEDYFLTSPTIFFPDVLPAYAFSDHGDASERHPKVKELLDGLDNILDIYSLYLK